MLKRLAGARISIRRILQSIMLLSRYDVRLAGVKPLERSSPSSDVLSADRHCATAHGQQPSFTPSGLSRAIQRISKPPTVLDRAKPLECVMAELEDLVIGRVSLGEAFYSSSVDSRRGAIR